MDSRSIMTDGGLFLLFLAVKEPFNHKIQEKEICQMPLKCPFSGQIGEFKMRPQEPKHMRLRNWIEDFDSVDTLHQKAIKVSGL